MHPLAEAPIGYFELDRELRCTYSNAALARLIGLAPRDLEGRRASELLGAAGAEVLEPLARALLTDPARARRVLIDIGRPCRAAMWAIRDGSGACARVGCLVAEPSGEQREVDLLMGSNVLGVVVWRVDGGVIDANDAFLDLIGYSRDDLRAGRIDWRALTPPEHRAADDRALAQFTESGSVDRFEKEYVRKDGSRAWVLIGGGKAGPEAREGVAYAIDITERKRAEEALRRSQVDLGEAERLARVGSWRYDLASHTQMYSEELRRIYGIAPGNAPIDADAALDRVHPDDRESIRRAGLEAMRPGGTMELSFRGLGPGDSLRYLRAVGEAIVEDGRLVGLRGATQDVTAERRAADDLRESEARFRALIENLFVGVVVYGPAGDVRLVNRAALELLGLSHDALAGAGAGAEPNVIHDDGTLMPRDQQPLARAIATGQPVRDAIVGIQRPQRRDRNWLLVNAVPELDAKGAVKQVICTLSDVTERRRMQARLALADRLASVGTLAAGVAHEINNPLSYVIANLAYLAGEIGDRPELQDLAQVVAEAQDGAARVRDIVRDLRTFSRGDENQRGAADVRRVIDSSVSIVWNQIRHTARLTIDVGELPAVPASEARLGQVFVNLLANAAQAIMPGAIAANEIRVSGRVDAAGRVVIEVADTGCGIPPEDLNRIFDPFFTTKPIGVGTGLGLSVCQGIVAELDGEITVESTVGKGTTFRVALPALDPVADAAPAPRPPAAAVRARARVLVIDDEPAIGASIARQLSDRHDVVAVTSAIEALELIGRDPEAFDAVLCDVHMPDLDGMRLHERLRETAPTLARRTIFLTGGAFTVAAREFLAKTGQSVLEKPFDREQLVEVIDGALRA